MPRATVKAGYKLTLAVVFYGSLVAAMYQKATDSLKIVGSYRVPVLESSLGYAARCGIAWGQLRSCACSE